MTKLSSYLHDICAVETAIALAADSVDANLQRFGPVRRGLCKGFDEALGWLLPMASFSSRYLLVPCSEWTLLLCNGPSIAADDQLFSVSKAAGCRGIYGRWASDSCNLRVVEAGRESRSIICYEDGARWMFHQQGEPLPFENQMLYEKRRKRDRLPPKVVEDYLGRLLPISFPPDWRRLMSQETICLKRSTHEFRTPAEEYVVEVDL